MIISNFSGNLGNHMFIYALTRTVAELNNYAWGFNRIPEFDYLNGEEQLNIFEIDYGEEHSYKYFELPENYGSWKEPMEDMGGYYFHKFSPSVFSIADNTKLFIPCGQDARYYNKEKLRKWFKIKNPEQYTLPFVDNNSCVINIRGGEYKGIPALLLEQSYWDNAIRMMREKIENCKFFVVSDDVPYAQSVFPQFKVEHHSMGMAYWMVQNAPNLIISNSSFAIIPAWLNTNATNIIAPFGWARHNVSQGYWASSSIWTFGFTFIDQKGNIYKYG